MKLCIILQSTYHHLPFLSIYPYPWQHQFSTTPEKRAGAYSPANIKEDRKRMYKKLPPAKTGGRILQRKGTKQIETPGLWPGVNLTLNTTRPDTSRPAGATEISSPSLVGQTAIFRQAVLLALDHSLPKPSQDSYPSGITLSSLPITVAGPRRTSTGLPY